MVSELPGGEDPQEAGALARKMVAALRQMVEVLQRQLGLSAADAVAKADAPGQAIVDKALKGPADQVGWADLEYVARSDPEAAARQWQEVVAEALDELRSGHRPAKAVEPPGTLCWERASFLAARRDLAEAWQPRNGAERQLVDMLAQAWTVYQQWMGRLTLRSAVECRRDEEDMPGAPRLSDAEATYEAAAMAERWHAIYLRTLEALREQQRRRPAGTASEN
jgi:hypothetical protein